MLKESFSFFLIFFLPLLFQSCCTSNVSEDKENEIKNALHVLPLTRGLIEATVSPSKVWQENNFSFCEAAVVKVHKTGGGIRPIAEDTSYKFELNPELIDLIKSSNGGSFRCKISETKNRINEFNEVNYKILLIIKN